MEEGGMWVTSQQECKGSSMAVLVVANVMEDMERLGDGE